MIYNVNRRLTILKLFSKVSIAGIVLTLAGNLAPVWGQIVPDDTLGDENSQVTPDQNINEIDADLIEGGAQREGNLFHSFSEFNVEEGQGAYFANPEEIANIFSRVTGNSVSEIMGTLGVSGDANLFLINPNGIIFGENASLDLNGSFVGSSANSVLFDDEVEFSATDPDAIPLLTIDIPIGLQYGTNPGAIANNSTLDNVGLEVSPGQNLSLLGGEVNLNGGLITAPGGTVELGGLSAAGTIKISEDASLDFPPSIARSDVSLTNGAEVNVRAGRGGFINVDARNLLLSEQSRLFAGIAENMGSPDAQAGDITIDATDSVKLIGNNTDLIGLDTEINNHVGLEANRRENPNSSSNTTGNGGSIFINTSSLEISNEARITANSFARGDAGDIVIDSNNVAVKGKTIASLVNEGRGNAGNVVINSAENLILSNSSNILSQVINGGKGNAGNITLNVGNSIDLDRQSLIIAEVQAGSSGNSGNVVLNTAFLSLKQSSFILADSQGTGNAGDININANNYITLDGLSLILSQVQENGIGEAGDISISSPSLSLSNFSLISTNVKEGSVGSTGNIRLNVDNLRVSSGSVIDALTENDFDGGNIDVIANSVDLSNGGKIVTSADGGGSAGNLNLKIAENLDIDNNRPATEPPFSESILQELALETGLFANTVGGSTGNGGSIEVEAESINLENGGSLSAATSSRLGGGVSLKVEDILSLQGDSLISAEAASVGDGGNINIDAGFIIAQPPVDSRGNDIVANAFQGTGGRIDLTTQGIFGIEPRNRPTQFNDITASSEFGLSGVVEIESLQFDPSEDALNVPLRTVEASVTQTCESDRNSGNSEFTVTGRGGLSDSPRGTLESDLGWEDWRESKALDSESSSTNNSADVSNIGTKSIVEAQQWIVNEKGSIELIAGTKPSLTHHNPACQPATKRSRSHRHSDAYLPTY